MLCKTCTGPRTQYTFYPKTARTRRPKKVCVGQTDEWTGVSQNDRRISKRTGMGRVVSRTGRSTEHPTGLAYFMMSGPMVGRMGWSDGTQGGYELAGPRTTVGPGYGPERQLGGFTDGPSEPTERPTGRAYCIMSIPAVARMGRSDGKWDGSDG